MDEPNGRDQSTVVEKVEIPMPFPVFATPSYTGWCSIPHRDSMIYLERLLVERQIPHAVMPEGGDPYLDKVRDKLATQFLEDFPQATHLFFIDDDVGFPAEKVIQFLIRPEPVLAGVYPSKNDQVDFPVRLLGKPETGTLIQNNGLLKVDNVGAGFLCIKRAVLEALIAADKAVQYRDPYTGRNFRHFFACGVAEAPEPEPGLTYWGEDSIFVNRCMSIGIDVWADPDIDFSHTGRKTWRGNMLTALLERGEKTPEGIRPLLVVVGGSEAPNPTETGTGHQEASAGPLSGIPEGDAA